MTDNQKYITSIYFLRAVDKLDLKFPGKEIAEKTGHDKGNVSKYLRGSLQPSNNFLQQFEEAFDLRLDDFADDKLGYSKTKQSAEGRFQKQGVPYFGSDVSATISGNFDEVAEAPEYYINIPPLNDCNAWFTNRGESMYPKFKNGEVLGVKTLTNLDAILPGESYLVITDSEANNLRTVKNVHYDKNNNDVLILRATNPDYSGDLIVKKKDVVSIHLIIANLEIIHN